MTQIISRVYDARGDAEAAAAELAQAKYDKRDIHLIGPDAAGADAGGDDSLLDRLKQAGITGSHADTYAERIRQGGTLLSVAAYFGKAAMVTAVLDKHGPAETGLAEQGYEKVPADPAAPLSSYLGWRVLLDDPAPLSKALRLPTLTRQRTRRRPDAALADNPAPFSRAIKQPVLTNRPAILSARFGWRVLWDNAAPLSRRIGMPVLSREQKLPGARLGLPLLSRNAAPFSRLLGLKVLSNDPAPLSRLFKWRVLSDDPKGTPDPR